MAFSTQSTWACVPSSIIAGSPSSPSVCSSRSDDKTCEQGGQHIDVPQLPQSEEGVVSNIKNHGWHARFHGRSWQQSFDSQEFGFSYTLVEPADVAPADELFYKGQILPLQTETRLHVVQALSSCMREDSDVMEHTHAGRPSSVNKDDEVKFSSCRIEGAMGEKLASTANALGGMRSLSFRSQHSGYWESGGEKDSTDTSSSSRDSNGSSQDSYIPNCNNVSYSNSKMKPGLIPWKSFLGGLLKAPRRQHNTFPTSLPLVAFSEDLSKYKPAGDPLLAESKKVVLGPLILDKDNMGPDYRLQPKVGLKSKFTLNHCRFRGGWKGKCSLGAGLEKGMSTSTSDTQKGRVEEPKHKSEARDCFEDGCRCKEEPRGTVKGRFTRFNNGQLNSSISTLKEASTMMGTTKSKIDQAQRKSTVREKWQGYAKKLKPLYEVKRGFMGQLRMDDCGKNACEVESGIVKRRPSWQRRLSHQSSFFRNHKQLNVDQAENVECSAYYLSNNNMHMAMSSCPPSTRSSPNHSGVLAQLVGVDNKSPLKLAQNVHQGGGGGTCNSSMKKNVGNEFISMSTMHELHSAVQSAIAHCKESNRSSYYLD